MPLGLILGENNIFACQFYTITILLTYLKSLELTDDKQRKCCVRVTFRDSSDFSNEVG